MHARRAGEARDVDPIVDPHRRAIARCDHRARQREQRAAVEIFFADLEHHAGHACDRRDAFQQIAAEPAIGDDDDVHSIRPAVGDDAFA